jgi:hypothetical protein
MVPNTRISNCNAVLASNPGTNSMKAYTAAQLRTYSANTIEELPRDYSVDPPGCNSRQRIGIIQSVFAEKDICMLCSSAHLHTPNFWKVC